MNVLEINDAGLLLADGSRTLLESPGFAALDGKQLVAGDAARARSRLDPRRANHRFWYQLDAPLSPPLGAARSSADLAYAHLQSIKAAAGDTPLLIAAPGTFSREQLGILLGLVEASGLKASGLVDTAVAAASTVETDARTLHLDVQLHRFVLTVLDGGAEVASRAVQEVAKPGLTAVWDAAAQVVAEAFVHQTRFDPLHTANTEQTMFDALPAFLPSLAGAPTAVLELGSGSRTHRASVERQDLVDRLAERFDAIVQAIDAAARPRPATLLLSARVAALPGLAAALDRLASVTTIRLDALAPVRGALAHADAVVSEGPALARVTRLPGQARTVAANSATDATHVLFGDRARPLPRTDRDAPLNLSTLVSGAPGALRRIDGQLWLDGAESPALRLNGAPARLPTRVALGDLIEASGVPLRLIEVSA